ncbi:MAG: sodium:proton antiporter [Sphingobacteriaceae bacterium]|nr:sodium:proton antiporter [Sphingobacteriaceae bacterium]
MSALLLAIEWTLPLKSPVLIFSLVLFIILFAPLLLARLRIPGIIGLILAGVAIGPNGFNLLLRDASIQLFGTVGLLYIMFLAGLEIDLKDFKKNRNKSLVFGAFTFAIPMILGTLVSLYVFKFSMASSILLASMFASHTLLAYPIASRYGVSKALSVNVTVGGTIITDTLALLVLAVIAGSTKGELNQAFWVKLSTSVLIFGAVVLFGFPYLARWFFKKFEDAVSQYIFTLAMVFLAAFLAEVAGIEGIIGAFLAGLALNRLIPHTSALMNRLEFVGNALFIPFFLIGVGMLVDLKVLFQGPEALFVAATMTVVAIVAKWLAAYFTQKSFGMLAVERQMMFGLSNAQAAATLAAVLVGYNLGLLNESVLNGTIVMILVTCLISSFAVERASRQMALLESTAQESPIDEAGERILVPLSNPETVESLLQLALLAKDTQSRNPLYALTITREDAQVDKGLAASRKLLEKAVKVAAATDQRVETLNRMDMNVTNGIVYAARENNITHLVIGWNPKPQVADKFFGSIMDNLLRRTEQAIMVYRGVQPVNTIRRILVVVPENAEFEPGFVGWVKGMRQLIKQTNAQALFFGSESLHDKLNQWSKQKKNAFEFGFRTFTEWDDFLVLSREVSTNDLLVVVSARKGTLSYQPALDKVPNQLGKHFELNSFAIIFPEWKGYADTNSILQVDATMPSPIQENLDRIEKMGKMVKKALGGD